MFCCGADCPILDCRTTQFPEHKIRLRGRTDILSGRALAGANIGLGVRGRLNFALSDQDQREQSTLLTFALQMGINYI